MSCKTGTHHCACDCREAEFAAIRQENAIHQTTVRTLSRSLVSAQWHERRLRAALEELVEAVRMRGLEGEDAKAPAILRVFKALDKAKETLADDQPLTFDEDSFEKT